MRDLGIIVSKNGPIPASLLSLAVETTSIARDAPRILRAPQVLTLAGCRMALMCWGYQPPIGLTADSEIIVAGPHALTFSGGLYHPALFRAEEVLQRLIDNEQTAEVFGSLGGDGVMMYCDGARGLARVARTVAGGAALFFSDTTDLFVAGTHALFVACVAQRSAAPSYDLDALAEFALVREFSRESTAFHGVKQAPIHSQISVNHNGAVHVTRLNDDFDNYGLETREPAAADYDELAQTLVDAARHLAPRGVGSQIGISGGKDSRLLLGILRRAGVDATAYCGSNYADHPDLVVGQLLLNTLGIPFDPPYIVESDAQEDVTGLWETRVDTLLQSELVNYGTRYVSFLGQPDRGAPYKFGNRSDDITNTIEWSGTGGELLKGGLTMPEWIGTFDPSLDLMQSVARSNCTGNISLLSPELQEASEQYWEEVWRWIYRPEVPLATLSRFYLDPFQSHGSSFVTRRGAVYLFGDTLTLRLIGRRFPVRSLQNNLPHFEMIRRLLPEALDIPLAIQRWCFEMDGPRPGDEEGYRKRSPVQFQRVSLARNQVGFTNVQIELKPVFMEALRETERLLGDRLDFRRIREYATTPAGFQYGNWLIFWTLRSIYLLTSNRWLRDMEPEHDPLRAVRFDLPWNLIYHDIFERYVADRDRLLQGFGDVDWPEIIAGDRAADAAAAEERHPPGGGRLAAPRFSADDDDLAVSLEYAASDDAISIAANVEGAREHPVWIFVPVLDTPALPRTTWSLAMVTRSDAADTRRSDVSLYPRGTGAGSRQWLLEYDFASGPEEAETRFSFAVPATAEGGVVEVLLPITPLVSSLTCRIAWPQPIDAAEPLIELCRTLATWFAEMLDSVCQRHDADTQVVAEQLDRVRSLDPVWVDGVAPDTNPGLSAAQLLALDGDAIMQVLSLARSRSAATTSDIEGLVLQPIHSLARYLAIRPA